MATSTKVVFWDVQHGHATYIKSPNDRHIVVDLGIGDYSGRNSYFSPLQHIRYEYGVTQLNYVIITHPHLDHIDDILNFDALSPKTLLRPYISKELLMAGCRDQDKPKLEKYWEIHNRYNQPISTSNDPNNIENYGGLIIRSFVPNYIGTNLNNYSIVVVLEYAGIKIVIPGDNEKSSLDELMERKDFKDAVSNAYILLAPHHGRESGYNSDFVSLVNPSLTIVSDGKYCDTSANKRYSQNSSGWGVYKNGTSSNRKCLTTNSDGEVYVEFGYDNNQKRFLSVYI